MHYDSRVDKFNKRLQLVRQQQAKGDMSVTEEEIQHVSLYEFWWKYCVYRGRVKRSTRPVVFDGDPVLQCGLCER